MFLKTFQKFALPMAFFDILKFVKRSQAAGAPSVQAENGQKNPPSKRR